MTTTLDPSRRYAAAADSPYAANLAALWMVDANLAAAVDAIDDAELYVGEASRAGPRTISLTSAGRKAVYLHSRFDPIAEAKKLADTTTVADRAAFYIHGTGLGYHIDALADRIEDDALLCVLEPDLKLIRAWLTRSDVADRLLANRLLIFSRVDKSQVFERLTQHSALISMGFEGMLHAPSLAIAPDFHRQMQTLFEEFAAYTRTSINTLMINGRRTIENIARNLKWYATTPDIADLKDIHRGMPAIVVSAGPSLRKNLHLVREAVGKAVIIAVQTTLQPLLEAGIEPDYVTSLDWSDISTRFFERLPTTLRTTLVAEAKVSGKVMGLFPGPVRVIANDAAEQMLTELRLNKVGLRAGATVAHLAYYLAEYLGCDPIIFIGQDLGFSDGLCYTPGTSYEDVWRPELSPYCTAEMKQWEQIVRDRAILRRVNDYQGRPTYTEERLYTYLQQFERDFAGSSRTIIDATEGGVLKRGANVMTLRAAIDQHCTAPTNSIPTGLATSVAGPTQRPDPTTRDRLKASDALNLTTQLAASSVRKRLSETSKLLDVSNQTLSLLTTIRDAGADQSAVNAAIAKLDPLRREVESVGITYAIVARMSQRSELRRFQTDRRIKLAGDDELARQRAQVDRDIENVHAVIETCGHLSRVLEEALTDFASEPAAKEAA